MKDIPTNSLIENYLPADYVDSFSRVIRPFHKVIVHSILKMAVKKRSALCLVFLV